MSGEGHLRELERRLDDAVRRYHDHDAGTLPAAYWHGIARGYAGAIAVIAHTTQDHEWLEAIRRAKFTRA